MDPWPGTLCCVLEQDTTFTVPLSIRQHGPLGLYTDFVNQMETSGIGNSFARV